MSDVALGVGITAGVFFTLTGLSVLAYFWFQRRARERRLAIATGSGPRPLAAADYPDLNSNSRAPSDDPHHSARSERSNANNVSQRERAPTATQYAPINKRHTNAVPIANANAEDSKHSAYSDVPRQSAVADDAYSVLPGRSNIDHVGAPDQRYDPLPLGPPTDSADTVSKSYGYASAASARAKAEQKNNNSPQNNANNPNRAVVVGVHSMVRNRAHDR